MFLRILVVLFWIFTLLQPASAQSWRRRNQSLPKAPATGADKIPASDTTSDQKSEPASKPAGQNNGAEVDSRQEAPRAETHGWVWVSRTIDLAQQLGGEDNLMTL